MFHNDFEKYNFKIIATGPRAQMSEKNDTGANKLINYPSAKTNTQTNHLDA